MFHVSKLKTTNYLTMSKNKNIIHKKFNYQSGKDLLHQVKVIFYFWNCRQALSIKKQNKLLSFEKDIS